MKTTINYGNMSREEADTKAVDDTKFYLGVDGWAALMFEMGQAYAIGTAEAFQSINMSLAFCGVQGFPVHALGRKYMLPAYRAWMHSGKDPVMTDDKGYALPEAPKDGA